MGCKHPSACALGCSFSVSYRGQQEVMHKSVGSLSRCLTEAVPVHWTSNANKNRRSEAKTNAQNETTRTFLTASGVTKFIVQINFYCSLLAFISLSFYVQIHHLVYKVCFEVSHLVLITVHGKGRPSCITSPKILVSRYKNQTLFYQLFTKIRTAMLRLPTDMQWRYTSNARCWIKLNTAFIMRNDPGESFPEIKTGYMHGWKKEHMDLLMSRPADNYIFHTTRCLGRE